jgi:lipoprotein-releasing system permease protein
MYKTLLCWRYLRTRYLAFACIVSVMLGVATLIVVNSVMSGFSTKLRERLHQLLSDVVVESPGMEGFGNPDGKMAMIRNDKFLGPRIEAMSATMEVFAMLQYQASNGRVINRPVKLIGVDAATRSKIGGFHEHLEFQKNRANPGFDVPRPILDEFERRAQWNRLLAKERLKQQALLNPDEPPPPDPPQVVASPPQAAIVGHLIATYRATNPETGETEEFTSLPPGTAITLTTVSAQTKATIGGETLTPVSDQFIVTDYFKSEMSEYDSNYIFVDLRYLQHLRTAEDRVTSIQVKLKNYDGDSEEVVKQLQKMFASDGIRVDTWEDKQGPLLAAINIEKNLLNILLFMIVAVAGFGILAIFSMIVSEKTRDIGVLKALGAPSGGIMQIFIGYGLLLGLVGCILGSGIGLWLSNNINWVENRLADATGHHVFNPRIYYFNEIPTDVQAPAVLMVNLGAIAVAVLFSILPAIRAARLQPVQALRYE